MLAFHVDLDQTEVDERESLSREFGKWEVQSLTSHAVTGFHI